MAARSCAPAATANVRVLAPVKWGRSRRGGAYVFSPQAEMHRARAPLSASLGTFSAWRKYLALRRNRRRSFRDTPPDAERRQRGGGKPPPYVLRVCRGVSEYWKRPGPARAPAPTANLETSQHGLPRPDDRPRKAPCRWGRKVSSISYGRQQAGPGRVGSRSAGRKLQATPGVIGGGAPYTKKGWWVGLDKSRHQAKPQ